MERQDRVRLARRAARCSQLELAKRVGVNRSAVANWESRLGNAPCSENLERLATTLEVSYEWLATGRGAMKLGAPTSPQGGITLANDAAEERLLRGWRSLSGRPQKLVLELVENYSALKRVKICDP